MKLRKRMMLFNALIVLVSLIILLAVGGIVIHFFARNDPFMERPHPDANIFTTKEIFDRITGETDINTDINWEEIDHQIAPYGYHLLITDGENTVYSSLEEEQTELISRMLSEEWTAEPQAMNIEGNRVIGMVAQDGETVIAINNFPKKERLFHFQSILIVFLLIGTMAILVIFLCSQLFFRRMARQMTEPLHALADGAHRIEQGDLSQEIIYNGKDEFTAVCTAFNRMQRHILEERERNNAYEKARTDLVAGISHDLRTPLTSVKGYIKGLRDGVANTPEKEEQYLSIAYQKACYMDVLLQKLFYFSKLETGSLPLYLKKEELSNFIQSLIEDMQKDLEQKGATISLQCDEGTYEASIDTEQMGRVFTNLVENALKYSNRPQTEILITLSHQGDMERIVFQDNGDGVPQEHLPYLFQQFWRGDEARSAKNGEGSGLGLYIVKYIVEAHGGTVSADNRNGLAITILLPRERGNLYETNTDC